MRSGKGDQFREVSLNRPVREALDAWLPLRRERAAPGEAALFVGPKEQRLSPRAIDTVVRSTARRGGLELSAHALRRTCVTNLVRAGNDIVLVAELAGHRRLETTRRYSYPRRPTGRRRWTRWRSSRDPGRAGAALPGRRRRGRP